MLSSFRDTKIFSHTTQTFETSVTSKFLGKKSGARQEVVQDVQIRRLQWRQWRA
jgi:hypothetical protein